MAFNRHHIHAAKLTPEAVLEIRQRYATEGWTQGRLSRFYKVSVGQIGRIVRGESWQQYQQVRHDQELEFMGSSPSASPVSDADISAMMENIRNLQLNEPASPITAELPVAPEIAERAAAYGAAPIHRKAGLSSEMNAALDDLEAARAQLSKPAIQAQAADATVDRDVPLDPPGTGLAGYSPSDIVECELVGVARPMHSIACPNIDILDPEGAFKNAAECPCQHENPLGVSK